MFVKELSGSTKLASLSKGEWSPSSQWKVRAGRLLNTLRPVVNLATPCWTCLCLRWHAEIECRDAHGPWPFVSPKYTVNSKHERM